MKYNEIVNAYKNGNEETVSELLYGIKYKTCLPYNVKYGISSMMAINICQEREDGQLFIHPLKKKMVNDLLLLNYTDIERSDTYSVEDYDLLKEKGFFKYLDNTIGCEEDYSLLIESLEENAKQLVDESKIKYGGVSKFLKKTVSDILDSVVDTYKTKEGKASIKGILKDINSNQELLDTINNVVGRFELENVQEELMARLNKAKELENAEKKEVKAEPKPKTTPKKVEDKDKK